MGQKTTTHAMGSARPSRTEPHKIIVCIDGTGQDELKPRATNVRKISDLLKGATAGQKVIYLPGVGSRSDKQQSGKLFGKTGGSGAKRIRREALAEITLNYKPGDSLYLIGFSRGAAICRTLANAIHKNGIPATIKITRNDEGRFQSFNRVGALHRPAIEMLGLFDTVASFGVGVNLLGIPFQKINLFKSLTVAANVKRAYHLMAIDERRDAFKPSLMNAEDRISEVWFSGVHTDIGGGYAERELSNITLLYMINRAKGHGLQFDDQEIAAIQPDPLGALHDRDRFLDYKLGPRKVQVKVLPSRKAQTDLRPKLHKSVTQRMRAQEALVIVNKKRPASSAKYAPTNVATPIGDNYRIDRKD